MIDRNLFDDFWAQYEVHNVEKHCKGLEDPEFRIEMSYSGFEKMIRNLSKTSGTGGQYCNYFINVDKFDASDKPLVAKYDANRVDYETAMLIYEKLQSEFPGRKIIAIPNDINIEAIGIDGLTVLRDNLTDIINNLSYDNIIGF